MTLGLPSEPVEELAAIGIRAFTTTRHAGSFGTASDEPVRDVMARWTTLQRHIAPDASRLATAQQVHGSAVLQHDGEWGGWLRAGEADGHVATRRGTALAVTVADCVPIFIAHPSGAVALLHSGWRGTVKRIVTRGVETLTGAGRHTADLIMHLGPAICGRCYEVSPDVYEQLTGGPVPRPTPVDLRSLIAQHAREVGVRHVSISRWCTRCHNERFFSHRAGDWGRQLGVIVAPL